MSNPRKPLSVPTAAQLKLSRIPQSTCSDPPGYKEECKKRKDPAEIHRRLSGLEMEVRHSIALNPKFVVLGTANPNTPKPELAVAKKGVLSFRSRSAHAMVVVGRIFNAVPWALQPGIGEAMRRKMLVDGGAENSLGRLKGYYPRMGAKIESPPTEFEVETALYHCGLFLHSEDAERMKLAALVSDDPAVRQVQINPKAGAGFPVLGKLGKPGVLEMCLGLAEQLQPQIASAYQRNGWKGVVAWKRMMEKDPKGAQLVAIKGKAKGDYYTAEKVYGGLMRFYCEFPRQVLMLIQMATQVFEARAHNITTNDENYHHKVTTSVGITLAYDGAERLVAELEKQLVSHHEGNDVAFTHCGDDSMVVFRPPRYGPMVMFSLDCSSFDLTQHALATELIHASIRDELAKIPGAGPSAALWYAYARERLVVTASTVTYLWKHGGPSGMPLQSKVNDMLMNVLLQRVRATLIELESGTFSREWLEKLLPLEAKKLGLVVRLEDYQEYPERSTIKEALAIKPFLFVGYHLHTRDGAVRAAADFKRQMTQLPFPSLAWEDEDMEFQRREVIRLASTALMWGYPTEELDEPFGEFRRCAEDMLELELEKMGDNEDPDVLWMSENSVFGPKPAATLRGLLRALQDWKQLWSAPEGPDPEAPAIIEDFLSGLDRWADQVEAEQGVERPVRPARVVLPPTGKDLGRVETKQIGRPPPQASPETKALWAELRARYAGRVRDLAEVSRPRGRRRGRRVESEQEPDSEPEPDEAEEAIEDLQDEYDDYLSRRYRVAE